MVSHNAARTLRLMPRVLYADSYAMTYNIEDNELNGGGGF